MVIELARAPAAATVPTVIGRVAVTPSHFAETIAEPVVVPAVTNPLVEIVATFAGEEIDQTMLGVSRTAPSGGLCALNSTCTVCPGVSEESGALMERTCDPVRTTRGCVLS